MTNLCFYFVDYRNIEICDLTNASNDGPDLVLRLLIRRLQESDPRVVALALVIAETCMKNCGTSFAKAIHPPFMEELSNVGKGSRGTHNAEEALRLIQQWS